MNAISDLLAKKRAAQIARMEGEISEVDEEAVDRDLKAIRGKSRPTRARTPRRVPSRSMVFSSHARQRMSQRRMDAEVVYAIWRAGELRTQPDGRHVHVVTRKGLAVATAADGRLLRAWMGCAIVVAHDQDPDRYVLLTVLASGEDTRVWGG